MLLLQLRMVKIAPIIGIHLSITREISSLIYNINGGVFLHTNAFPLNVIRDAIEMLLVL